MAEKVFPGAGVIIHDLYKEFMDSKKLRLKKQGIVRSSLNAVSAGLTEANLTLGQVAVDGKSNEITAIPSLLELLDIPRLEL